MRSNSTPVESTPLFHRKIVYSYIIIGLKYLIIFRNIFLHFAQIYQSRKLVFVTEFWRIIDLLQRKANNFWPKSISNISEDATSSFYEDAFNQVSIIEIVYIHSSEMDILNGILLPAYRKIQGISGQQQWKSELIGKGSLCGLAGDHASA